jgi:hypothetical protein
MISIPMQFSGTTGFFDKHVAPFIRFSSTQLVDDVCTVISRFDQIVIDFLNRTGSACCRNLPIKFYREACPSKQLGELLIDNELKAIRVVGAWSGFGGLMRLAFMLLTRRAAAPTTQD